ncbi:unnamed protein product [Soboliphyme baturini]|uniref:Uncharacterized protein n=1 Tax=Soboliphyme baturini TaxID=241478 RepID=A0A183IIT9_9BILA|nr:unnamed protein product [Soboliphyme baturini]
MKNTKMSNEIFVSLTNLHVFFQLACPHWPELGIVPVVDDEIMTMDDRKSIWKCQAVRPTSWLKRGWCCTQFDRLIDRLTITPPISTANLGIADLPLLDKTNSIYSLISPEKPYLDNGIESVFPPGNATWAASKIRRCSKKKFSSLFQSIMAQTTKLTIRNPHYAIGQESGARATVQKREIGPTGEEPHGGFSGRYPTSLSQHIRPLSRRLRLSQGQPLLNAFVHFLPSFGFRKPLFAGVL